MKDGQIQELLDKNQNLMEQFLVLQKKMMKELSLEKKNIRTDDHPDFNETGEDRTKNAGFEKAISRDPIAKGA